MELGAGASGDGDGDGVEDGLSGEVRESIAPTRQSFLGAARRRDGSQSSFVR